MKKGLDDFLKTPNLSKCDVAASLFRRKCSAVIAHMTAVAAAFVFARLIPNKYHSRMKLLF